MKRLRNHWPSNPRDLSLTIGEQVFLEDRIGEYIMAIVVARGRQSYTMFVPDHNGHSYVWDWVVHD